MKHTKETLKAFLLDKKESVEKELDKWMKDFLKDPTYALSWSKTTFQATGIHNVIRIILEVIDHENCTIENIKSQCLEKMIHGSTYPPSSSSMLSNLMEQYVVAGWAWLYDEIKYS